jgi:glycosyltransferase involved in cell wall biosynthesis
MSVTVIVPCYNEENYIGLLLQDLTKQTQQANRVVVVDCHSSDKTIAVTKGYSKSLELNVLQAHYKSAASARNTGADVTNSDYLLFIDADMRLPEDFIFQITKCATSKHFDFVAAKLKSEGHHPVDHMVCWAVNFTNYGIHMTLRRHPAGSGGAMLVSHALHDRIGGYSPKLREFDDVDYFMRMCKHHVSFAYARKAVAITSARRSKENGRFNTILQGMSDHHLFVRLFVRPLMRKSGILPKWSDLN